MQAGTFTHWLLLAAGVITGSACATTAVPPKNAYRDTVLAIAAEHHGNQPQPRDLHDKYFTEIFSASIPKDAVIVPLTKENAPKLCELFDSLCLNTGLAPARLYLATDTQAVDAKFATHNDKVAVLLHTRLFSTFNTQTFQHYLRHSVLRRILAVQKQHDVAAAKNATNLATSAAVPAVLAALVIYLSATRPELFRNKAWLGASIAALIAAGGGINFWRIFARDLSTHAYEQVSTHENTEYGREDVFPGPSEGLVDATFNAKPGHLLDRMVTIKRFILDQNKRYEELRRLEEAENSELNASLLDDAILSRANS